MERRDVKVELLDTVHTLPTKPVPDLKGAWQHVDEMFTKLEALVGKEETRTSPR